MLPTHLFDTLISQPETPMWSRLKYAKVIMKLQDVLNGDFFNISAKRGKYTMAKEDTESMLDLVIRRLAPLTLRVLGNVFMLSEGQPGIDNVFWLQEGKWKQCSPLIRCNTLTINLLRQP